MSDVNQEFGVTDAGWTNTTAQGPVSSEVKESLVTIYITIGKGFTFHMNAAEKNCRVQL